jgi:hypothetical protein
MFTIFWSEIVNGRDYLEDLGVGGRLILEWILGEKCGKVKTGFIWLRIGPVAGCFEHSNELFEFHNRWGIS